MLVAAQFETIATATRVASQKFFAAIVAFLPSSASQFGKENPSSAVWKEEPVTLARSRCLASPIRHASENVTASPMDVPVSNRFSRPQNGALDAKARLGPAGSPITSATKKEERSALLASMPILDPPAQLRLYLTLGTRPPGELLKHIPSAIQLDDCWKFARLLATPTRAIDVTALLDASQAMMQKKSTPSVKRSTKGLLAVAKLWRTGAPPAVPTEATAVAFLRVATHLLDHRVNQTEWSMGKSNPPKQLLTNLMNISLELIEFQPSVRSDPRRGITHQSGEPPLIRFGCPAAIEERH